MIDSRLAYLEYFKYFIASDFIAKRTVTVTVAFYEQDIPRNSGFEDETAYLYKAGASYTIEKVE
jgi:hypothetical protein